MKYSKPIAIVRDIKPGDFYIHFKYEMNAKDDNNKPYPITKYLYKIISVADNASDNVKNVDKFVIYKNILTGIVYARDIIEFLSDVDKNKYPEIKQVFRFAKCDALGNLIDDGV